MAIWCALCIYIKVEVHKAIHQERFYYALSLSAATEFFRKEHSLE